MAAPSLPLIDGHAHPATTLIRTLSLHDGRAVKGSATHSHNSSGISVARRSHTRREEELGVRGWQRGVGCCLRAGAVGGRLRTRGRGDNTVPLGLCRSEGSDEIRGGACRS